jgi:alpha,alpha-trehalase
MSYDTSSSIARACTVFCEGPILHYVQISGIFNDSKTFVDMPLKASPETVSAAFATIPDPTDKVALENFLDMYFAEAGSDLDIWIPSDLQDSPAFLDLISDSDYKQWANDLNQLWKLLGRQVNASVLEHPERHTFLPRQYPMIVPGGRFRESYYWDSWWIIRGLLVCDMPTTAKNVLRNLLDDVMNFGFVPNGGRIYYLDRSQPPLLAEMAVSIIEFYGWSSEEGHSLLTEVYPILQQEYAWWMNPASGHVKNISLPTEESVEGGRRTVLLNHYFSNETTPRPESYLQDLETATGVYQ